MVGQPVQAADVSLLVDRARDGITAEMRAALTLEVGGDRRRVTVDRAAPTAISIAAIGTLWITDA